MQLNHRHLLGVCLLSLAACASEGDTDPSDDTDSDAVSDSAWRSTGFEIVDSAQGIAWMALDIDEAAYLALELPPGWTLNERDLDASFGDFLRSPGAAADGTFEDVDLYGHGWRHVATLSDRGRPFDDAGLLISTRVDKHHRLTHEPGRNLTSIRSPEGDHYLRVTRDPDRTGDPPTLPAGWTLHTREPAEPTVVVLGPSITLLRADNGDSFQGPVPAELVDPMEE